MAPSTSACVSKRPFEVLGFSYCDGACQYGETNTSRNTSSWRADSSQLVRHSERSQDDSLLQGHGTGTRANRRLGQLRKYSEPAIYLGFSTVRIQDFSKQTCRSPRTLGSVGSHRTITYMQR
jgi:hypothetical protein